ncbi:MAG TPA: PCYCGC motif-containing (lipo)protein [Chloroflexota bacterium]
MLRMGRCERLSIAAILLTVIFSAVSGCSAGSTPADTPSPTDEQPVSGPPGFPEYAYRSAQALSGYRIATARKALLIRLPCYCGCGRDAEQFKNLADCFFEQNGGYKEHASSCQVCLEEAESADRLWNDGASVRQVRELIDEEYRGRGKGTETPAVTESDEEAVRLETR